MHPASILVSSRGESITFSGGKTEAKEEEKYSPWRWECWLTRVQVGTDFVRHRFSAADPRGQHHLPSPRQQSWAPRRAQHRNPPTRFEEALGRGVGSQPSGNPLTRESD